MNTEAVRAAARLLVEARNSGILLEALPEFSRPRSCSDAYEIQLETVARMHDSIAGWKVALSDEYGLLLGVLLQSRMFADGAVIDSTNLAMIGVEAEIAFRFEFALPAREHPYERDEIAAAVIACPAIEILDSRFRDYHATAQIDRAADFMSNGAFVTGNWRPDWQAFDLSRLEARLVVDGAEIVRRTGGHAAGDPLLPALALANRFRGSAGVPAGRIVTTGTYTGLQFVSKSSAVRAAFAGFGDVGCRFAPAAPALG